MVGSGFVELGREKPAIPLAVFMGQLALCANEPHAEPRLRFGDESTLGGRLYKAFNTGTWPKWASPLECLRTKGLWPPWRRDHEWLKPNRSVSLHVDGACRASDAWLVWRDDRRMEGQELWSFLVDLIHCGDHDWSIDDLDPVLREKYSTQQGDRSAGLADVTCADTQPGPSDRETPPPLWVASSTADTCEPCPTPAPSMPITAEEVVATFAQESALYGKSIDTPIGDYTIDELMAALHDLAATYPYSPVLPTLMRARELQRRAWALRAQCQRPGQLRDLHRIAGFLCAILGNASFDLGSLQAALTQARVADLHGELAGDPDLRAWIGGFKALVAYWDGRFEDAVMHAESAHEFKTRGSALVRASSVQARALAQLGRAAEVDAALASADRFRERLWHDEEFSGILAFPRSKGLFWAASAHIGLDLPERAAQTQTLATEAVSLYEAAAPERRRMGELGLVRLDLVNARILDGNSDGVEDDVQLVLDSLRDRRIDCIIRRLRQLLNVLDQAAWQLNPHLKRTRERIRDQLWRAPPPNLLPKDSVA